MNSDQEYYPDRWIVIHLKSPKESFYRVFCTWYGGFTQGESWKMNSGITRVEETDTHFLFYGYSGSIYYCHKDGYGKSGYGHGVLSAIKNSWKDRVKITEMDELTKWMELDYQ